tara:strand:+ start:160 stop:345 length:186 start_codon:yes stop_codon:yes gene_type:complete
MNINKELAGLNRRIQNLRFREQPPTLRMKILQPWEVEEESDIKDDFCLILKIEDKNPEFNK